MTERQVVRARRSHVAISALAVIAIGLVLTACQSSGESASTAGEISTGAITPIGGQIVSSSPTAGGIIYPEATSTADSETGATIDVSPKEVTMGNIVLTLSVQPAQPAFDPGRETSGSGDDQSTPTARKGFAVLGGSTLKVTNNFDSAQNPPADSPREMLRHVAVQIKDKASGQLIPYAVVSMDLLRAGRPALQDQALVAMLQDGADVSQMQYGNNIKFPGKGDYQIFVRVEPSPLLNSGSNGVAQFNVSIK